MYTTDNNNSMGTKTINEVYSVIYNVLDASDITMAEMFTVINTVIEATSRDPHYIKNDELLAMIKQQYSIDMMV